MQRALAHDDVFRAIADPTRRALLVDEASALQHQKVLGNGWAARVEIGGEDVYGRRSRAQAIGNETREKLNAASEAERKKLEDQLSTRLAAAEKQIAATRETAMRNVRGIAADAAGAIVQRLTGVLPDGKTVSSAVDATLKG